MRAFLISELQKSILILTHSLTIVPIVLSSIWDLTKEHSLLCHPGTSVCLLGTSQWYHLTFLKAEGISGISIYVWLCYVFVVLWS